MYDPCQQEVIDAVGGFHLVLAPPGCGKTEILTERIRRAHDRGVNLTDMLCLTFTNRAARGMDDRMLEKLGAEGKNDVYVGNVHRFCSRFLFDNALVASESSVVDEDDAISILARFMNEDELAVQANGNRRRAYALVFQLCGLMHQIEHHHPRHLRLHPECLSSDDVAAMRALCKQQNVAFTADMMVDFYRHSERYRELAQGEGLDFGERHVVSNMLKKMWLACSYAQYKEQNNLLDFEDLLLLTYDALVADDADAPTYRHYPWIQVDEVQDLNPLQLEIIHLLATKEPDTIMYLGDEQQAIFSFMGAKLSTLEALKTQCGEANIHHLGVNHRSRSYLLDVFNTFAAEQLHIDAALLPVADNSTTAQPTDLTLMQSENQEAEIADIVDRTRGFLSASPTDTTAVVVNSNADADTVADAFAHAGIEFFKVSGTDIFATKEMKTLFAHLNVLVRDMDFLSWSRLLTGLHVFEQAFYARNFVRKSLNLAILPADHLRTDGSTYVQDFVAACDEKTLVVFDTETTGLNVFEDDIVQIAAVKMRAGQIVEGSELSLFIKTSRPIPAMLGDVPNPIIEEMKHHTLLDPAEALAQFLDYVGDVPLLGHNSDYDYHILDHNLRRYLPQRHLHEQCPVCFDSLRLARLLEPQLRVFKLKALLAALNLEGENSHLADADVNATCSLVAYCLAKARPLVEEQRAFMHEDRVVRRARVFRAAYADLYHDARQRMYVRLAAGERPALSVELNKFYDALRSERLIDDVPALRYVSDYLDADLVDTATEPSLKEQLDNHIMQLNTLKEADLCSSNGLRERVFVSTVHKAKGLEFDNVVVFDAVDGRWPNFFSQNDADRLAEDARKFYVAITRATRRIVVAYSRYRTSMNGYTREQQLTRFMNPVLKMFN